AHRRNRLVYSNTRLPAQRQRVMIDLSPELATIALFALLVLLITTGYPLALTLGGVAMVIGYLGKGFTIFDVFYLRAFSVVTEYTFMAIPLFIFMAVMVEKSGISEQLFQTLFLWIGRIRGSLAIVTIITGTILAATMGIFSASVVMLGLVALPAMMDRGYQKELATGSICAAGCLGILIPPSLMLILYGPMSGISVGKLFIAAIPSGFVLSGLYMGYIIIRCFLNPKLGPAPSREETEAVSWSKKLQLLFTSLIPPMGLIGAVLGSIFFGLATPTEAAGVGAVASFLMAFAYGRLTWNVVRDTTYHTLKVSSMICLLVIGGFMFTGTFMALGCAEVVKDFILWVPFGRWGSFSVIMFIVFFLGMFIDWVGILLIIIPIVTPIAETLKFDELWFAMMICISLQIAYLSPPYAPAIFLLRGVIPDSYGISTNTIIRGVVPYILLITFALALFIAFPGIITWLPGKMIK
ncbi:MAG: TRAP transporter large permease subunit, partial [Anaerolineales bacterium]|nr:TRAP transporter large permease subunit [Anaerolineales bacterium]